MLLSIVGLSGCSSNVDGLIEKGQYEEALAIIEESPDKYADLYDEVRYKIAENAFENNEFELAIGYLENNTHEDAAELLTRTYERKAAFEIETFYNEMLTEIEEYNPDKWNPNFDYMDGTDFYLRISDSLNETYGQWKTVRSSFSDVV